MTSRPEMDSPQYKAWRWAVLKRDGYKCQITGSTKDLEVHHIVPWAKQPKLRYAISNGITIISSLHSQITGNEAAWEDRLRDLVKERYYSQGKNNKKKKYIKRDWRVQ